MSDVVTPINQSLTIVGALADPFLTQDVGAGRYMIYGVILWSEVNPIDGGIRFGLQCSGIPTIFDWSDGSGAVLTTGQTTNITGTSGVRQISLSGTALLTSATTTVTFIRGLAVASANPTTLLAGSFLRLIAIGSTASSGGGTFISPDKICYTSDELVEEVMSILGVRSRGQPTDPEDFQYVDERLGAIFRKLAGLEICYAPDLSCIPAEWFVDLSYIVAGEVAAKFGATPDDLMYLVTKGLGGPPTQVQIGGGAAALSLKQQLRARPTFEPERVLYF